MRINLAQYATSETICLGPVSNQRRGRSVSTLESIQDAGLVSRAAQGDENAFRALFEANRTLVYNLAFRMLGNAEDAEDVFQDTFMNAFANIHKFKGRSRFSTWLYRIALNRARRALDERKRSVATVAIDEADPGPRSVAEPASGEALDVQEALGRLPVEYRAALVLHSMFGYTYEEAGAIMNCPSGTVKTYVHRGKKALRDMLEGPR